jgi:hypothetical protein
MALFGAGLLMMLTLLAGPIGVGGYTFDLHYMVVGSMLALLGVQIALLGINGRILSASRGILRDDRLFGWFERYFTLERGVITGGAISAVGLAVLAAVATLWISRGFSFGSDISLRFALLGLTLLVTGTQTIFSTFFISLLFMRFDGSPSERLLRLLDMRFQQRKALNAPRSDAA